MGTKGIKGEYTGFTFNGTHTEDLGITRVSGGDRYEMDLLPNFEDKTVDVPGGDGTYYFGSLYKNREFSFNLAYDGVTEQNLRRMQQLFGDRRVHPLVLDEYPFKTYYVRISSTPNFEYIAFDSGDPEYEDYIWTYRNAELTAAPASERIYKGEATIEFVCYEPWAHCIDKELEHYEYKVFNVEEGQNPNELGLYEKTEENQYILTEETEPRGKTYYFRTFIDQWKDASGLKYTLGEIDVPSSSIQVYNPGDLPAHFTLTWRTSENVPNGSIQLVDGENTYSIILKSFTLKEGDEGVVYDSKLHLFYGIAGEDDKKTGTVYNEYIDSGDFFDIPQTDESGLILTVNTAPDEILYDYLYF